MRIAVLTVAVTAAGVMPAALPSEAAVRAPAGLRVIGILNSGTKVEQTSYSLRRLRDLRITAFWNVAGNYVQRLEVRAPDGSLYQRLTKTFTMGSRDTQVLTVLPVGGRGSPSTRSGATGVSTSTWTAAVRHSPATR